MCDQKEERHWSFPLAGKPTLMDEIQAAPPRVDMMLKDPSLRSG
jgi:hypothetical protein